MIKKKIFVSTNLEQGQGYIEDDVQTLKEKIEFDVKQALASDASYLQYCIHYLCNINIYICVTIKFRTSKLFPYTYILILKY